MKSERNDDFAKLPDEVLVRICGMLNIRDVCTMAAVSRRWHSICSSQRVWEAMRQDVLFFASPARSPRQIYCELQNMRCQSERAARVHAALENYTEKRFERLGLSSAAASAVTSPVASLHRAGGDSGGVSGGGGIGGSSSSSRNTSIYLDPVTPEQSRQRRPLGNLSNGRLDDVTMGGNKKKRPTGSPA
eukprot:UC1_evm1s1964